MNFKAFAIERIVLMKSLATVVVVRFILYIFFFFFFSLRDEFDRLNFEDIENERINF